MFPDPSFLFTGTTCSTIPLDYILCGCTAAFKAILFLALFGVVIFLAIWIPMIIYEVLHSWWRDHKIQRRKIKEEDMEKEIQAQERIVIMKRKLDKAKEENLLIFPNLHENNRFDNLGDN